MRAIRLKTEYLQNPIGLGTKRPRLFWNCEGGIKQTAYEIFLSIDGNEWSSGRQESNSQHHDLNEVDLFSRSRVIWKVRLWDENGIQGDWSEEAIFELGLLQEEDWVAEWISGDYKAEISKHYPVDCFRKSFTANNVKRARLYATACGMYEIKINDLKVGNASLTPGATDFNKRVQVQTYDVTEMLIKGENVMTAELAGGWYKSYLCSDKRSAKYGANTKLCIQLEITDDKDAIVTVCTDGTWEWSNDGKYRFAENKIGEVVDAKMVPSFSKKAKETTHPVMRVSPDNVAIKEHEIFKPKLITTPSGKRVLDFGQNIAGFVAFELNAKSGEKITLYMGELLEHGEFTQRNIDPNKKHDTAFQKVEYTCTQGLNKYKTKFAIFGFQYVLAETDIAFTEEDFSAIAVYSDMEETLEFDSDNMLLNKLVEATRWSAKNNSADLPTDCPQRERVGWTGDAQIFINTASYLFDYAAFGRKYVKDLADAQYENGSYTQCAPRCAMAGYMNMLDGSAGWADAGVLIPYRLWKRYGDERIIESHYESMAKYGEFLIGRCGKKALNLKRPNIPKDLQKYLVMSGMSYGEWLEPKEAVEFSVKEIAKPHVEESTAYTAYSLRLLAEIAEQLKKDEQAKRFREYEEGCTKAYQALVKTDEYSLDTDRQAKLVRPLYMGLLDDETKKIAQSRLIKALDNFGWRVGTGFLSTPFLMFVLSDIGVDYAYRLLENEEVPGWFAMPKNGATTIWENWEGTLEENPVSLNHYSKGAVCEWIFSKMCGIGIAGENRFIIEPILGGSIQRASLSYISPYGLVSSEWRRDNGKIIYKINIPANAEADVILPDGKRTVVSGVHEFIVNV